MNKMARIKFFAFLCVFHLDSVNSFSAKLSLPYSSRTIIWTTTSRKIHHHDSSIVKLGSIMQGNPQQDENNDKGSSNNEPVNNKVPKKSLEEKMQQISNVASMLCVVDCTVLPIVTILLPLFGVAATSSSAALHRIGHAISLYFVLPGKILFKNMMNILLIFLFLSLPINISLLIFPSVFIISFVSSTIHKWEA